MMSTLLSDPRFYEQLRQIDEDLAREVQSVGCRCGGKLHSATYPRRPLGLPVALAASNESQRRLSFCCDREGCRRRVTPPSVRFLGRRFYLSIVVVLVSAMRHGLTMSRYNELKNVLGVSRRTIERWRRWWRQAFAASTFWNVYRAEFMPPPCEAQLPCSLLNAFLGDLSQRLPALLRWIAPITAPNGAGLMKEPCRPADYVDDHALAGTMAF